MDKSITIQDVCKYRSTRFILTYDIYINQDLHTSNSPPPVPRCSCFRLSVRFMMVAPVALAILLLSVFRILLMALMLYLIKKWAAISLSPFSVMTISGFSWAMLLTCSFMLSSSACNNYYLQEYEKV